MKKIIFCTGVAVLLLSSCSTPFNVDSYEECIDKGGTQINSYPKICEFNGYNHSDQSDEYGFKTWSAVCEELWWITTTPDNVNYFCELNGKKQPELEMMKEYHEKLNKNKPSLPPVDLIQNNIKNTELSAAVRLDSCEELAHDDNWITFKSLNCTATITNIFKGENKVGDKINLQYSDYSGKTTSYIDKPLIISVNWVETVGDIPTFKEPDVAHIFNYSPELQALFEDSKTK